jgi:hypothetical protein
MSKILYILDYLSSLVRRAKTTKRTTTMATDTTINHNTTQPSPCICFKVARVVGCWSLPLMAMIVAKKLLCQSSICRAEATKQSTTRSFACGVINGTSSPTLQQRKPKQATRVAVATARVAASHNRTCHPQAPQTKQKQNNNKTIGFWLLNQHCCTEREATIRRHCHPCHGCLNRKTRRHHSRCTGLQ